MKIVLGFGLLSFVFCIVRFFNWLATTYYKNFLYKLYNIIIYTPAHVCVDPYVDVRVQPKIYA